jgi:hypothetical protein
VSQAGPVEIERVLFAEATSSFRKNISFFTTFSIVQANLMLKS